jgi:hypothetical protein
MKQVSPDARISDMDNRGTLFQVTATTELNVLDFFLRIWRMLYFELD